MSARKYIVRQVFVDNGYGMFGWSDTTRIVDSEAEAVAAVAAPMPRGCWKQEAFVDSPVVKNRIAIRVRPKGGKPCQK